jgi:hypothetical protein
MSRRKSEITGHMNERDFPHLVELKLPPALRDCWTDRVRHDRAAGAERFFQPHGGIVRGLVLDLGIKLGADQHHDGRKPQPHHQADHGAERPVGGVVIGKIAEVPGKQRGDRKPTERGGDAADADPAPLHQPPARSVAVKHGEPKDD